MCKHIFAKKQTMFKSNGLALAVYFALDLLKAGLGEIQVKATVLPRLDIEIYLLR